MLPIQPICKSSKLVLVLVLLFQDYVQLVYEVAVGMESCLDIDLPDVEGTLTCAEAVENIQKTFKKLECEAQALYINHGEYPEGCEDFLPRLL